ncbi:MAG TPA: hypothetical protein PK095_19660, partial [Myxococcota bacterium]|nr:hypothetical protein [Myxococcota bacterium]
MSLFNESHPDDRTVIALANALARCSASTSRKVGKTMSDAWNRRLKLLHYLIRRGYAQTADAA